MSRFLLILALGHVFLIPSSGQVVIHDTAVRILAKPFGIGDRIRLQCIDEVHAAPDGSKRLVFTLESSGVKEVLLKTPVFSLDLILPDGKWASLGELSGRLITFPLTGEDQKISRTYVADLSSELTCTDIDSYLRQAIRDGAPMRLIGKAEMIVRTNGKTNFTKKGLKLELAGPVVLSDKFQAKNHSAAKTMPAVGLR